MAKKITLEWEHLERIAEYYEFPSAVFFTNPKDFPKNKTRNEALIKKAELFDTIKEITDYEVLC
jgi:hypothetical protein